MKRFFYVLLACACFLVANAQKPLGFIKGTVMDTASKRGLSYTTISLVQAKDSSLISFLRADSTGAFQLKNIAKGNYLVSASYVGFVPVWVPVNLKEGESVNLGVLAMTDVNSASAVTVNAKRAPVVMNNDTLEFNTENFKTQPNAVVEDLLKKLPGVVVDADGTVRVNGQKINRVLVNGKEFFTGDPKLATKNLDADAVDKVQVFDKKSDRAAFTGVDDGQTEKAINLKLKKDRNKSLFGKVSAGAGTDARFDAQTNINKFNGDQQISLLGMANNTNRQGFSINDVLNFSGDLARGMRSGGGINIRVGSGDDNGLPISGLGQNQQGIAKTFAGGVNFNDTWKKKTDVNGSFIASDVDLGTERSSNRQNLLPGNNFDYVSNSINQKRVQQQRVNFSIDQKVDSFISFKIVPQITFQQNDNRSTSNYVSTDAKGTKLNDGSSDNSTRSEATNMVTNVQYRQRLKKKGRTISSNLNWNDNNSTQTGALLNRNSFYVSGISLKDSITNQRNTRDAHASSFGGNLIYTEPIGKKSLLEFSVFYNSSKGRSNRKAYDYNVASGKFDLLNKLQSNDFKNSFEYGGGGISWRSNQKKINYTIGTSLQTTSLISTNNSNGNVINQRFTDMLPSLNLQYKLNSTRNLSLNYGTSTQNPSTTQLQPIIDVTDPLNTYTGNPNLKRTYVQNLSLNYFNANTFTQSNFFAFVSASRSDNAIVNSDIVQTNGSRITSPVNTDGVYNLFANADMGFPIKKLKSRIDIGLGTSYMNNVSFINLAKNTIINSSFGPNISWSYGNDTKFDLRFSARVNFSNVEYTLQPQLNSRYLQQIYGLETNNSLPWGLLLNNNFNYTINSGRAYGYNLNLPLWNLSMAKGFLKNNRAEIKFSVFDLLNKNVGVSRNASQNYIEDTRYNVLQRYFMLTASYRLNKAGSTTGGARIVVRSMGN